ncbi:PREDICTED: cilia- and flagella-associated protein 20-like [Trachymyrmex cornetzi]|uniref:cilia- and flagella-associated protein 20-like n=1 Tax=Trachymyrmex cornetzi TaxID=471704 RepID=UPI00084F39E6|nr:PREDICTED: cilia- and flagella-associated protein 20-like [Trachymyrmex cornetzi]
MFRNTYQGGFLSILYSCGSSPLELWDMHVKNGYIRRITDEEIKSLALEIAGTNVATTYIYCPAYPKKELGIKLPFLIIIIKNMKKYFTFEITILDDKNMHRRFRVSNFQSMTRIRPFSTSMPIGLSGGWNQIQFNLSDFTQRAYGTNYIETTRMQIHANCRIRRVYFADRLYSEDEMPEEFKLFLPMHRKKCGREEDVPKKPSLILKVPSVEVPTIEPEVEEILEPLITKEPDLIEEAIPDVRMEEVEKIVTEKDEEKERQKKEAKGEAEEIEKAEEEAKKEEEEIKDEETVVDEEEKVEPAVTIREYEVEEENEDIYISKLEGYTEDENEDENEEDEHEDEE